MAYARALVAGYQPDNIDDLISFADAFGASRLRYNFKRPLSKMELILSVENLKSVYFLSGELA